jgi:hypothetical protein
VADCPGADVYAADSFRVEWGPIFHRGRLDGSAQILVLGQDPAAHESVVRRILIGVAGQRAQGLLGRLGISRSYTMVNTFLYSVYGQAAGDRHWDDAGIAGYRQRWLDTMAGKNRFVAAITFGSLAANAYGAWVKASNPAIPHHAALLHPTYPEAAAAAPGGPTIAEATQELLANWNSALPGLHAAIASPDEPPNLAPYGTAFTPQDLAAIPPGDLPPGLPSWMRSLEAWAERTGSTADEKRATITVTVPDDLRPWTT